MKKIITIAALTIVAMASISTADAGRRSGSKYVRDYPIVTSPCSADEFERADGKCVDRFVKNGGKCHNGWYLDTAKGSCHKAKWFGKHLKNGAHCYNGWWLNTSSMKCEK